MMLPRKRQRPNPADTPSSPAISTDPPTVPRSQTDPSSTSPSKHGPTSTDDREQMPPPKAGRARPSQASLNQVRKTSSWYGSWPRVSKASPSTSVTQENIFGGSVKAEKAPDFSRFDNNNIDDAASTASRAASGSGTRGPDSGMHNGSDSSKAPADEPNGAVETTAGDNDSNITNAATTAPGDTLDGTAKDGPSAEPSTSSTAPPEQPASAGWRGWWTRAPASDTQQTPDIASVPAEKRDTPAATPRPSTPASQTAQPDGPSTGATGGQRSTSWFGLWSATSTPAPSKSDPGDKPPSEAGQTKPATGEDAPMSNTQQQQSAPQQAEPTPKAGTTWAFWSRDSPKGKNNVTQDESGEIAVMGEGSEAHPKPMVEGDISPSKDAKKKDEQSGGMLTWRRNNKRNRPQSMDSEGASPAQSGTSTPQVGQGLPAPPQQLPTTPASAPAPVKEPSSKSTAESETATKAQKNLLLPSFQSTYQMKQDPSIIKQIAQFVLRSQEPPVKHVFRHQDPPKIRKAISIGVHGLLPATYLRPMIGQPTGTSLRFASLGAEAIRRWTDSHGSPDCDIEKVALEGEGKINERVDNLWRLMLNWIEHIRQADLILLACHSQGVPVSIMLLEKLIDLGIVTKAKIGVCAMAGVSLGPFPEYKSGILMGSAAELWDFGNPETVNAQRFEKALKRVLHHGARITFIGSIDDQLVPMESAVYSPANHPYIYRAVFIDGRVHAPDFISHLVGFALKLRNLGVSEHGLIRELSVPLAGSLYTGEGHSRLYYDDQVYDLAISHALETTAAPGHHGQRHPECEIRHHATGGGNVAVPSGQSGPNQPAAQQPNPYVLPWIMRGLLEEEFVKTELSQETEELLRQFDDWKPANKALKDVKYRLEAVRSKL